MVTIRDRRKDRILVLNSLILAKKAGKQVAQALMMARLISKILESACISRSSWTVLECLGREKKVPRSWSDVRYLRSLGLDPEYATIIIMDADVNQSSQTDDTSPEA